MGIRNRFMITTGALALLTIAAVGAASYELSRQAAVRDAKEKGRIIFTTMEAIQTNFVAAQRPLLLQVVEKDRFYPELMSGAVITRMVWEQLDKKLPGYQFKQAAVDPRWVPNKADELEAGIIQTFRSQADLKTQEGMISKKGEPFYYFATRRNAAKGCLQCHSDPATAPKDQVEIYGAERGYAWKEGDVAAAFVVYVPLAAALEEARANALRLLAVAGAGLALALAAMWLLLDRNVVRPIVELSDRTESISMGKGLEERVTTAATGEIATLAAGLERLRVSIAKLMKRSAT
jgi:methyl-accepting chemotaxis protein